MSNDGTRYCQNCGAEIKYGSTLPLRWGGAMAGASNRGFSLGALAGTAIENQAKETFKDYKKNRVLVKVIPRADGTWYCPDCGQMNKARAGFCSGCGRDFI